MRRTTTGKAPRHKLWSKESALADLRRVGEIKAVCLIYAEDGKYHPYQTDVWRWRQDDPEYDLEVSRILVENGAATGGGRKPLDAGDKSWHELFGEALVRHHWALDRAVAETPYSLKAINDFLDPTSTTYDPALVKVVEAAEMQMASRAREIIVGEGLNPDSYSSFEASKVTQTKLWGAHKALEKLEKRFSKRMVEVSGKIDHSHSHRYLPPNEKLAMLIDDRNKFMLSRSEQAKQLPPAPVDDNVIDVEEVESAESV